MTLQFINGIAKFRVAGTEARAFAVWAREFAKQRVLCDARQKDLQSRFDFQFGVPRAGLDRHFYCASPR